MGAGKFLAIIGGLITLVGTFAFNWFTVDIAAVESAMGIPAGGLAQVGIGSATYIYGYGGIMKIMWLLSAEFSTLLTNMAQGGFTFPTWMPYVFVVIVLLMCLAGILQLIGVKSRALAITGSLVPMLMSLVFILINFNVLSSVLPAEVGSILPLFMLLLFGTNDALVTGVVPMDIPLMGLGLGIYLIFVGSLLAFVSGFMSREDF